MLPAAPLRRPARRARDGAATSEMAHRWRRLYTMAPLPLSRVRWVCAWSDGCSRPRGERELLRSYARCSSGTRRPRRWIAAQEAICSRKTARLAQGLGSRLGSRQRTGAPAELRLGARAEGDDQLPVVGAPPRRRLLHGLRVELRDVLLQLAVVPLQPARALAERARVIRRLLPRQKNRVDERGHLCLRMCVLFVLRVYEHVFAFQAPFVHQRSGQLLQGRVITTEPRNSAGGVGATWKEGNTPQKSPLLCYGRL